MTSKAGRILGGDEGVVALARQPCGMMFHVRPYVLRGFMKRKTSQDNEAALASECPDASTQESSRTRLGHGHLNDVGFGSFVSYFFCMLAAVSVRPAVGSIGVMSEGVLASLLAFVGAMSLSLLVLALADPYLLRHGRHRQLAILSGVLMMLGPAAAAFDSISSTFDSIALLPLFALSGCGYAVCLVMWGRVLSSRSVDASARQVLADSCAAVIVMVAVSLLPETASVFVIAGLGLVAGLISSAKVGLTELGDCLEGQVVLSDTRDAIPWTSYLAGGVPWMIYGVFLALLSDVHVLGGYLDVGTLVVLALAAVAGIAIVRLHRRPSIDLSRLSWAAVPLLVTGLVIYVAGE